MAAASIYLHSERFFGPQGLVPRCLIVVGGHVDDSDHVVEIDKGAVDAKWDTEHPSPPGPKSGPPPRLSIHVNGRFPAMRDVPTPPRQGQRDEGFSVNSAYGGGGHDGCCTRNARAVIGAWLNKQLGRHGGGAAIFPSACAACQIGNAKLRMRGKAGLIKSSQIAKVIGYRRYRRALWSVVRHGRQSVFFQSCGCDPFSAVGSSVPW